MRWIVTVLFLTISLTACQFTPDGVSPTSLPPGVVAASPSVTSPPPTPIPTTRTPTPTVTPSPTSTPTPTENPYNLQVLDSPASLQDCPSLECEVSVDLETATSLEVIATYQDPLDLWYQVLVGSQSGWLRAKALSELAPEHRRLLPTTAWQPSPTPTPTATAASLAEVVAHLDTPQKLSNFLRDEIEVSDHPGCISYWPDVFYLKRQGNCKDFATFSSYVLAQHGYQVQRISYTYGYKGVKYGHEVTAYWVDSDLWVMSNYKISGPYDSLQDYFDSLSWLDYLTLTCIKPPGGVTCCW